MTNNEVKELSERVNDELKARIEECKKEGVEYCIKHAYELAHKHEINEYLYSLTNEIIENTSFDDLDYSKIKNFEGNLLQYFYDEFLDYDSSWPNLFYWVDLGEFLFDEMKKICER